MAGSRQRRAGDDVTIITNQTPFYGESGGQMGDAGTITGADGLSTRLPTPPSRWAACMPIAARSRHSIKVGDAVAWPSMWRAAMRSVPTIRPPICCTRRCATLGGHVTQKGSLVAPDRLRFDFSQPTALTADIAAIEAR
jgi:alanyl-tRNA synthetase